MSTCIEDNAAIFGRRYSWHVVRSYLSGAPDKFTTINDDDLYRQIQAFADAKKVRRDRPTIGKLEFDASTDQVDAFFYRGSRRHRFMTVML